MKNHGGHHRFRTIPHDQKMGVKKRPIGAGANGAAQAQGDLPEAVMAIGQAGLGGGRKAGVVQSGQQNFFGGRTVGDGGDKEGFANEIRKRNLGLSAQTMLGRHRDADRVSFEDHGFVRKFRLGKLGDQGVHGIRGNLPGGLGIEGDEPQAAILSQEFPDAAGDSFGQGPRRESQGDFSRAPVRGILGGPNGVLAERQHRLGFIRKNPAGGGEFDLSIPAIEKGKPQVPFEFSNLDAQRRLGHPQRAGGLRKIEVFADGKKISKLA